MMVGAGRSQSGSSRSNVINRRLHLRLNRRTCGAGGDERSPRFSNPGRAGARRGHIPQPGAALARPHLPKSEDQENHEHDHRSEGDERPEDLHVLNCPARGAGEQSGNGVVVPTCRSSALLPINEHLF